MGHLHNPKEGNGSTVNGSVMGSDDYSISHRMHTKPTQLLKVYYGDDTGTFKLTLDYNKKSQSTIRLSLE